MFKTGVFIKQDCHGNCQLQRWYDRDGNPNAIIVAMRLIRKGEQLMCIDGPEYKAFGVLVSLFAFSNRCINTIIKFITLIMV